MKSVFFPALTVDQSDRIISRETAASEMISSQISRQRGRALLKASCEGTETQVSRNDHS